MFCKLMTLFPLQNQNALLKGHNKLISSSFCYLGGGGGRGGGGGAKNVILHITHF